MKKHTKMYTTAIAATLATSALVSAVPTQAAAVTFKDVSSSNEFYEYITNLADRGIIHGYGDDTFRPTLEVRRDHAAKIIAGVLGLDTKNVANPQFTDVPATHAHYNEIAAIKEAGIISGDGYGNFLPEKALTRGEMAKIIANAFDLKVPAGSTTPLTDIKGNMFEEYITALYVNGVTKGTGDNTYKPSDIVTREQLAAFVVRAEEIASKVVDKEVKVDSIDGDTIVVDGEVLVLTEELKAVFNEKNAAALKNAKVELVVRYANAPVASLSPVANTSQGIVIGVNYIELPNADTTFNAGGFILPEVTVTANGVTVLNGAISTLTVAKGATATLENVIANSLEVSGNVTLGEGTVVTELNVTGDAKITVEAGSTFEKITLEKGKTLADVIANYEEVKEQLKDVVVETAKETAPTTSGGYIDFQQDTTPTLEQTVESVIKTAVNNYNPQYTYAQAIVDTVKNELKFEIVDATITLAKVRTDMLAFETANTVNDIINEVSGIGTLYENLVSIEVGTETYKRADLLNRTFTKNLILKFVDDNQGSATNIGDLEGKATTVKVNFKNGSLQYTLKIVDEVK
jgi:hypothetical protein